jgi:hypothetical protein
MAVSHLKMHQIFMLALAGLRAEGEVAQVLVVPQPPPLAFLVFHLSDWWEACATSTAALEVTRQEPWNDRRNTRKTFSFPDETSTWQ